MKFTKTLAIELAPHNPEAHFNLGSVYQGQSKTDAAQAEYDLVLQLKPGHAEAHFNRALCYLAQGDFARGWPEYEWRLRCKKYAPRPFSQPLWRCQRMEGQTLLVHAEQGLGDTLQFVRFLPMALERSAARVVLEVQPALIPLLTDAGLTAERLGPRFGGLLGRGNPPGPFDAHLPLMSLTHVLGITVESLPVATNYLRAQPARVERWRAALARYQRPWIGINWQGSADYWFDQFRSVPLAALAPLAGVPGATLLSLHKGSGESQIAAVAPQFSVVNLSEQLDVDGGAFLDTAAVMQCVDLVVSVDTSTVHLAGGLGVPVWMPTSAAPEWRWLLDRDDSPWYPGLRIFRQREPGCWQDVFERIAAELGLMIVAPDTSPRGDDVPDDPDKAYDFGLGAGFYVDATQEPWAKNYRMYSYCARELPELIAREFPQADLQRAGISGHSMGGHGALTIGLKNPDRFKSISAFAPIVSPLNCPWGEKALGNYIGQDRTEWRVYDSCALIEDGARARDLLVDQGTSDQFLTNQLKPELLKAACEKAGQKMTLRMQDGYDHSYFFMATFIEDHLRWHAQRL